jgi:hypothetical protein
VVYVEGSVSTTVACHFANAVEERGHVDLLKSYRGVPLHKWCLGDRWVEALEQETATAPCDCWCHQEGGIAVNHLPGAREGKGN